MSVTFRRLGGALAAALLTLIAAAPVAAHAELTATFPEAGATVDAPPTTVAALFTEPLQVDSSLELLAAGTTIAFGGIDPDDARRLIIRLDAALDPGDYEARWEAFSGDGHLERGVFTFSVAPTASTPPAATASAAPSVPGSVGPSPAPSVAPTEAPLPSPSARPDPPPASGSDAVIPIVAVAAVVAGLGLFLLRGRGAAGR